jgi:hypothetical protein
MPVLRLGVMESSLVEHQPVGQSGQIAGFRQGDLVWLVWYHLDPKRCPDSPDGSGPYTRMSDCEWIRYVNATTGARSGVYGFG